MEEPTPIGRLKKRKAAIASTTASAPPTAPPTAAPSTEGAWAAEVAGAAGPDEAEGVGVIGPASATAVSESVPPEAVTIAVWREEPKDDEPLGATAAETALALALRAAGRRAVYLTMTLTGPERRRRREGLPDAGAVW